MDTLFFLLKEIETSGFADILRKSIWLYPIVNTAHVLGVALLVGAIAALDLRLIGFWRSITIAHLARPIVPIAATGMVLTLTTGVLLFITRATRYAENPFLQIKLVLIALALANLALLHRSDAWRAARVSIEPGFRFRLFLAGFLSILLWIATLIAGRMIAYW